jgi:short-subunit dehydrogenase
MIFTHCFILHKRLRERGITIDVLINNAGRGLQGPFLDGDQDDRIQFGAFGEARMIAATGLMNLFRNSDSTCRVQITHGIDVP